MMTEDNATSPPPDSTQSSHLPDLVFRAAVTGHRDIAAEHAENLEILIRAALQKLSRQLHQSAKNNPLDKQRDIQLHFVSALAEGADQIAAQAAIKTENWQLHSILPFEQGIYAKTFGDAKNAAKNMKNLAEHAQSIIELADWQWSGPYLSRHTK